MVDWYWKENEDRISRICENRMQKISAGDFAGVLESVGVQIFVHLIFYY